MRHASLFSGIGGFELAASWMGWENVLSCEIDPFCQAVLKHHFPTTTHYGDIRQLDGKQYRGTIDILTGGFPCQPFSAAGQRKGTADNRFLWPEMFRVIQEISPRWIVAENVRGITSIDGGMVFERVCAELESAGYEVRPFCIPACAVGAPHRRERLWFVANRQGIKQERNITGGDRCWESEAEARNGDCHAPDTHDTRLEGSKEARDACGGRTERNEQFGGCAVLDAADTQQQGLERKEEGVETREEHQRHNRDRLRSGLESSSRSWNEPWLQAATRLCRVDDGIPRRLFRAILSAYGMDNEMGGTKRISADNIVDGEMLRRLWEQKESATPSPLLYNLGLCDRLPEVPCKEGSAGWLPQEETAKTMRCLWKEFYSAPFQESHILQQRLFEQIGEIERNETVVATTNNKGLCDMWFRVSLHKGATKSVRDIVRDYLGAEKSKLAKFYSRSAWRRESLKAYGNAIVPQVAYQIFKAIESADSL